MVRKVRLQSHHIFQLPVLLAHDTVYIGAAASIAFLQTVRQVVAGQIGPSNFSHSKDSERMLEIEAPQLLTDTITITNEQKLHFLQCYFSVVSTSSKLLIVFDLAHFS